MPRISTINPTLTAAEVAAGDYVPIVRSGNTNARVDISGMALSVPAYSVVNHSTGFTFVAGDVGKVHTNRGGTAMQIWQLPAGGSTLWFISHRIAAWPIRLKPNGTEGIADGGNGKYMEIQSRGRVVLAWMTDRWEIVSENVVYSYEA